MAKNYKFKKPYGITNDLNRNIIVADYSNNKIVKILLNWYIIVN